MFHPQFINTSRSRHYTAAANNMITDSDSEFETIYDVNSPEKEATLSLPDFFQQLHDLPMSQVLSQFLADYIPEKEKNIATFQEGIQKFITIANLRPEPRLAFYDNQFLGLYYPSNIAELWNQKYHATMYAQPLIKYASNEFKQLFFTQTTQSSHDERALSKCFVIEDEAQNDCNSLGTSS